MAVIEKMKTVLNKQFLLKIYVFFFLYIVNFLKMRYFTTDYRKMEKKEKKAICECQQQRNM